jgi:hypothetical protein
MSNRIKNIINEVRTDVSGKWVSIDDLENHTKSVIDECLDVIKKTPTNSAYTTFDMGVVKGTIEKSVETVKKHFYEKK